MNYFNKAEKTLKSCLKEKLSITTATIVGFLIAGTVAFGAGKVENINGETGSKTFTKDVEAVTVVGSKDLTINGEFGKDSDNAGGRGINIGAGNGTIVNNATITQEKGISVSYDNSQREDYNTVASVQKLVNNGTINASYMGIYSNKSHQGYAKEIENNGIINVNATDKNVFGANIQEVTVFTNTANGKIDVKGKKTNEVIGVKLTNGATGINNGTINVANNDEVKSQVLPEEEATFSSKLKGVYVTSKDDFGTTKFTNNGTINVNGDNGVGIYIDTDSKGQKTNAENGKIVVENGKGGVITLNGENSVGVYLNNEKATFTNNGTIALNVGKITPTEEDERTSKLEVTSKNLAIRNDKGTAKNLGKIKVTDKTATELEGFDINNLFKGTVINKGMLVDKGDNIVSQATDIELSGDLTANDITEAGKEDGAIVIKGDSTLTANADKTPVEAGAVNVAGAILTVGKDSSSEEVAFKNTNINLANSGEKAGQVKVANSATLTLEGGTVTGIEKNAKNDIELGNSSTLALKGATVNANIGGANSAAGTVTVAGDTKFSGKINVKEIKIGNGEKAAALSTKEVATRENKLFLSSTTVVGTEAEKAMLGDATNTITIENDGQLVLEVGANGDTALSNSTGVTVTTGTAVSHANTIDTSKGADSDILLSVGNLNGDTATVKLGEGNTITASMGIEGGSEVYTINEGTITSGEVKLTYNTNLFAGDSRLNSINNGASGISNLFSANTTERAAQLGKILDGSIYSETAKASYNSIKLAEETLRGMDRIAETGKWAAKGSALYNRHEYDKAGYNSEMETSGLLGAMEYGLDNNTAVGVAFGGAYQDVDSATGNADGTTLYLGTYAKKVVGAYNLTAGIGYQYGSYDANNTTGTASSSDSYDSNAVSTYVEGRYTMDLGSNLSFQPKAKLGYTYVKQADAQDANITVSDAELSTFDTEIGADLVKAIAMKDGKANLVFGASYVRAYGDTDKDFRGQFAKSANNFDIKGAMLSENTGKFNLTLEVAKDNGLFYNGGVNLNIGDDNTRDYGVTLGAGYKF